MPRHSLPLVVSLLAFGSPAAYADTFNGWRYTPPPGYTTETATDHVSLNKVWGGGFCSIAIFEPRAQENALATEQALEWHNAITPALEVKVTRRGSLTSNTATITKTTAAVTDDDGNHYARIHYVVATAGMIGSVLLASSNATTLAGCAKASDTVVRSLGIDWTSSRFTDPEARVETPYGRWAFTGPISREYSFETNGTYRFHRETPGVDPVRVVDERGTYKFTGRELSLMPQTATVAVVTRGLGRTMKGSLEKATYTWSKTYDPTDNEWRIILQPRKPTERDGKLPGRSSSYEYSDTVKPDWKFSPQPGV